MTSNDGQQGFFERQRYALWLVTGVLVAGALLFAANWKADQQEWVRMEAFRGDVADMAQISETIIADRLREYDNSLLVLRDAYVAEPKRFAANIRLLRSGPLADRELLVVLVDREGFLAYTDTPEVKKRLYLGDRKYFRYFADGGRDRLYIDEPSFGRVTRRYVLPLARPIHDGQGRFLGVIALSVKQESLGKFGPNLQLSGDTTITLVNRNGAVISRSHNPDQMQGRILPQTLLAPMLQGTHGEFQGRAVPDGVDRVIAYRHVGAANTPLIVYAEASPAKVLRETSQQRAVLMWLAGFTSFVIFVLILVYLKGRNTDLKLIATLRKSKEFEYKTLTQASLDGFWISEVSGRILDTNDAFRKMLGYTKEELLGLTVTGIEACEAPDTVAAHAGLTKEAGSNRFISRLRRKNGTIMDVEISAQYVSEPDECFFVFVRDITQRKRWEQQLQASRKQYCDLVEGTNDLITKVDKDGRFLFVNHAAREIYGLAPEQCIGLTAFDFVHPEDKEATAAAFDRWLKSGEITFTLENRQLAVDGREHLMAWSIRAETDENGSTVGFASSARDVTYRRKAEEERAKLESQLLQAMKMESVGSLAGGVAHDFNNKLTVIIGHACLALTETDPDRMRGNLEEIRKAAEQSADLTRQLLAFARKQTIAPKLLDLNETVPGMLKMLNRLIGEDIDLVWRPSAAPWLLKFDPSQIDQILANLCVNARDSITAGGRISIEIENRVIDEDYCAQSPDALPGEYVCLVVGDNGCGMDQGTLARIFEPYFTTKETGKGTGLGLAMVYGIVKQNKGFIKVYSKPGVGTRFAIHLPRHAGDLAQEPKDDTAPPAPHGRETILLVEDELAILEIVTTILTRQGYTVLQANTPTQAVLLAKEHVGPINLLVTDVIMPEINGRELADELHSLNPQLKCLFMSGYTADAIAVHGVLEEGVNFIQKPFSLPDLASAVRDVLDLPPVRSCRALGSP